MPTTPSYYLTAALFDLFVTRIRVSDRFLLLTEILTIQSLYATLFSVGHNGGTWFISHIMTCYLVFPLIVQIIREMRSKNKIVLMAVLPLLLFYMPFVVIRFQAQTLYSNPFIRSMEFDMGMLFSSLSMEDFNKSQIKKTIIIMGMLWSLLIGFLFMWLKKNGLFIKRLYGLFDCFSSYLANRHRMYEENDNQKI